MMGLDKEQRGGSSLSRSFLVWGEHGRMGKEMGGELKRRLRKV